MDMDGLPKAVLCALAVVFFALLGMAMIVIDPWPIARDARGNQPFSG